jgi:general stress protein YciG
MDKPQWVQEILKRDPDHFKKIGAKGGSAKVPKGFAVMDKERLREVSAKGGSK